MRKRSKISEAIETRIVPCPIRTLNKSDVRCGFIFEDRPQQTYDAHFADNANSEILISAIAKNVGELSKRIKKNRKP